MCQKCLGTCRTVPTMPRAVYAGPRVGAGMGVEGSLVTMSGSKGTDPVLQSAPQSGSRQEIG